MKLNERIQRDREQFKQLPDRSSKINFLWDYYRIPILALLTVIVIALIVLIGNLGRKDTAMHVVLLNSDSSLVECDSNVFDRVLEESSINLKKRKADINDKLSVGQGNDETADIETLQVLSAMFMINDLDLYVADQYYFDYFAANGIYCDLSGFIDEDILKKHSEDLYYIEDGNGSTILGGIVLHEGSLIHQAGYYHDDVIMGVPANAGNADVAIEFIRLLLSDRN